jgi:hypothetical protein
VRDTDGGLIFEAGSPGRREPKRYIEPHFAPSATPRGPEKPSERQAIILEHGSSIKLCSVAFVREPSCAVRCRQVGSVNGTSMSDDAEEEPAAVRKCHNQTIAHSVNVRGMRWPKVLLIAREEVKSIQIWQVFVCFQGCCQTTTCLIHQDSRACFNKHRQVSPVIRAKWCHA